MRTDVHGSVARGVVRRDLSPFHPLTLSPSQPLTLSPSRPPTLSLTLSPSLILCSSPRSDVHGNTARGVCRRDRPRLRRGRPRTREEGPSPRHSYRLVMRVSELRKEMSVSEMRHARMAFWKRVRDYKPYAQTPKSCTLNP